MFMRYEWGMGIGHTYSWKDSAPHLQAKSFDTEAPESEPETEADEGEDQEGNEGSEGKQNLESENEGVFCLEDRENELLNEVLDDEDDWVGEDLMDNDDETCLEEIDMYDS